MALFRKKNDPLTEKERVLSREIAELEAQIKRLDSQLQQAPPPPRFRSTAVPHGATLTYSGEPGAPAEPKPASIEPIFEQVSNARLETPAEPGSTPDHFNELGVRKYDLPAFFNRLRKHFRGPSASNPKLVSYLAAGGLQGLRPLRYEKRVARNRFILLVIGLFLALLGLIWAFVHNAR